MFILLACYVSMQLRLLVELIVSVPHFILIYPVVVKIFDSGAKCWTNKLLSTFVI